jgi:hypothetical protein
VVEKHHHFGAGRWWRTARDTSQQQAQLSNDPFEATIGDSRRRGQTSVAETLNLERAVGDSALGPTSTAFTLAWSGPPFRFATASERTRSASSRGLGVVVAQCPLAPSGAPPTRDTAA